MLLLYIALGGALGAIARYGLGGWVHGWAGGGFPWGTLLVNVAGCLGLGIALRYMSAVDVGAELRAFVAIGFFGAFTTFSTFSYDTAMLLRDGEWARAAGYLAASVGVGLVATFAGFALAVVALQGRR